MQDEQKPIQDQNIPSPPDISEQVDVSQLFQKDDPPPLTNNLENAQKPITRRMYIIGAQLIFVFFSAVVFGIYNTVIRDDSSPNTYVSTKKTDNTVPENTGDNPITVEITKDSIAEQVVVEPSDTATIAGTPETTVSVTPSPTTTPTPTPTPTPPTPPPTSPAPTTTTHTINYTNSCFSPTNKTIKRGDTVKFVNNSNRNMWPASNNHPSHNILPSFNANQDIAPGGSYTYTFSSVGSWGYHDHNKPNCDGVITAN